MRFIFFLVVFLFYSCSNKNCDLPSYKSVDNEITINNYIDSIIKINNQSEFIQFLNKNSKTLYPFFDVKESDISKREQYLGTIYSNLIDNVYYDSLHNDVVNTFDNIDEIIDEINYSFYLYNRNSNNKFTPDINVLVSGFFHDIEVDSENITIGIEYFLNKNNKFKPSDLPSYVLDRYTPKHLTSTILSTFFSQFNIYDQSDQSMINEMIAFGKLYYIISEILPCVNHNIILGYSSEDYDRIQENEAFIYSYFIQNELFFNQKDEVKKKYLDERPKTFEISSQIPGRIGRWLGYQIVRSFMKSSPYSYEELLLESDYTKIFYSSNYKPI